MVHYKQRKIKGAYAAVHNEQQLPRCAAASTSVRQQHYGKGSFLGTFSPPCQDSCRLELKNFRGPETTKMNTYSPERKAALIARMMPPHNQSVVQLA
ncbi:hypothetical protein, partial [Serratia ficaria]|uniref:hypothetical protein n=1 Tax=Serratia ficaria TaxID=61651 RepID=UPI0021B78334